jgi:hypothetical protein
MLDYQLFMINNISFLEQGSQQHPLSILTIFSKRVAKVSVLGKELI